MIAAVKRRFFPVDPVLPAYVQPKNARWIKLRNILFLGMIAFVGLIYGGISAIFPVFFYVYALIPLLVLVLVVIWALPEAGRYPAGALEKMFFAALLIMFLWPNYMAIALPGLPWITMNRLISFPLVILFLISLSISVQLRTELGNVLKANKWLTIAFVTFVVTQTYTVAFAQEMGAAVNRYIDAQTQWTAMFFLACWVFTRDGRGEKYFKYLMLCAVLIMISGLFEWRLNHVWWRDYIPSFLKVPDDSVQRSLQGQTRAGVNIYRVQGTFSTSLNLAEFLAFTYCIAYYWLFNTRRWLLRIAMVFYLIVAFGVIILTDSRTGPVCVFTSLFAYVFFWTLRRWTQSRRDVVAPFIITIFPFFLTVFLVLSFTWNRLKVMTWGGGQHQSSTDVRLEQWHNFWPAIGHWPLGYGIAQGAYKAGTINAEGTFTLDSYYIMSFLDYGVIGGFAYYAAFIIGIVTAFRYGVRGRGKDANLLLSLGALLVAFLVSKLVLIQDDSHGAVFMALGMVAALAWRENRAALADKTPLLTSGAA